jgi:hypothetical protein
MKILILKNIKIIYMCTVYMISMIMQHGWLVTGTNQERPIYELTQTIIYPGTNYQVFWSNEHLINVKLTILQVRN